MIEAYCKYFKCLFRLPVPKLYCKVWRCLLCRRVREFNIVIIVRSVCQAFIWTMNREIGLDKHDRLGGIPINKLYKYGGMIHCVTQQKPKEFVI